MSRLMETLSSGCQKYDRYVGWQGGGQDCEVFWDSDLGLWSSFQTKRRENRYVLFFGTEDPNLKKSLSISCEINPLKSGINLRCAGSLLMDENGNVFLAHNGKVGGGRKGIGKSAFIVAHPNENWRPVDLPGGRHTELLVIGRIDKPEFKRQIAYFVRRVDAFKSREIKTQPVIEEPAFTPEFAGVRRAYSVGTIEAQCNHGPVTSALKEELEAQNLRCTNDRFRDLYTLSDQGRITALFEVKTDCTPYSIYTAIGQLLIHTIDIEPKPKRFIVLPEEVSSGARSMLQKLEIRVVTYSWHKNAVTFKGLSDRLG